MNLGARKSRGSDSELGAFLRHWREVRGKSQFDLAIETGVSQRHISFIESGRSVPSRQKLIDIAAGLDVPLRERNVLLLAAGYAPIYSDAALDAPEMESIVKALKRVLRQHEPFPAVVMDRYWNVVMTNEAAPQFFGMFIDMAARPGRRNLLHLMFDPKGMRPFIADWEAVSKSLLARVYREAVGRTVDETTAELIAVLLGYSGGGRGEASMATTPALAPAHDTDQLCQRWPDAQLFFDDHDCRNAADDRGSGTPCGMHVSGERRDRRSSFGVDETTICKIGQTLESSDPACVMVFALRP